MNRDDDGSSSVDTGANDAEPTMTRARKLTDLISMRLSPEDSKQLDAVCERIPMARLTVARIAMRLGLAELQENPARILDHDTKPRGGRSRARKK